MSTRGNRTSGVPWVLINATLRASVVRSIWNASGDKALRQEAENGRVRQQSRVDVYLSVQLASLFQVLELRAR